MRKINMKNYSVYHYSDLKEKIYDKDIDCSNVKNDEEMVEFIRNLRKGDDFFEYMWERSRQINVLEKDGSVKTYDSPKDSIDFSFFDTVSSYLYYRPLRFIKDSYYSIKYAFQRMFRGYDDRECWSIDYAIINLIKRNLPKMIKNLTGCPQSYIEKAVKLLNPNMSDEDVKTNGGNHQSTEVAFALWKSDLEEFLLRCKLIEYYDFNGLEFEDEYKDIDKNKYSIPYYEFSKEIDYKKLYQLREDNFSKIIEFLKDNFFNLWD